MSSLFLWAVFGKIVNISGTLEYMASKNMPYSIFFLSGAIFLQLVGGLLILLGYKTKLASWMLILFIIPAVIIFHDFWNIEGKDRLIEQIIFMNDIAILGGLFAFAAVGAGRFSIDRE